MRLAGTRGWAGTVVVLATAAGCAVSSSPVNAQSQDGSATAALTGRVFESGGLPVAGATVGVFGENDTTITSDSGRFTLSHVSTGPHMLWIRRLGFETMRASATVAAAHRDALTFKMVRTVPLLPTVSTTAVTRAFREVGLDRRMRAGIGQFLTDSQIERRHATRLSDLLDQIRGIVVWQHPQNFEASVDGTRGVGSCVGFDVDGEPQTELYNPAGLPTDDADNLMDPAMIGAIEVYSSSERPLEFGPGREERPLPPPGSPPPVVDLSGQQCGLVVIWTKTRLGLLAAEGGHRSSSHSDVRGDGVFPTGPSCTPPSPVDTTDVTVYATLNADGSHSATDTSWSRYAGQVLTAIRSAFVMPSDLPLPAFGYPLEKPGRKPRPEAAVGSGEGFDVEPTLSAVASFTLDSSGQIGGPHIAVSSMSGAADTSLLAAITDAAAGRRFPHVPAEEERGGPTHFDLIVSTVRPAVGDAASLVGRITVPVWPLSRRVTLASGSQPTNSAASTAEPPDARGPRFEFVVNQQGRVAMPSVQAIGQSTSEAGAPERGRVEAVARLLPELRFEPALIGECPVSQLTTTSVTWAP